MKLKVYYERIGAEDGDVIVIRPNEIITSDRAKELYDITKNAFPNNHVVVMLPDYLVKKYKKEEFLKFLDELRDMVEE